MAKQRPYHELFRVGDVVEVQQAPLDGETKPHWLRGRVIKISTRLHVSHGRSDGSHMAYDRADYNKGLIRNAVSGMADIPTLPPRLDQLRVGERVEAGEPGADEYDTGTVVVSSDDSVRVYWDTMGGLLDEDPSTLRRLTKENDRG